MVVSDAAEESGNVLPPEELVERNATAKASAVVTDSAGTAGTGRRYGRVSEWAYLWKTV